MVAEIRSSLDALGVHFDVFFSETSLHESGALEKAVARLREEGHVYDADGAVWLRTTDFGDDKDRVLVKADGEPTYFAADCAYYLDKRARGFDKVVIMLGADHSGYVGRYKALVAAAGDDPATHLEILIGQLVNLLRDGEPVRMSKRAGTVVNMEDLVEAIGVDASRYALARASVDQQIDIDVELWSRKTNDNPVFYVQYAHARISSVLRNAADLGLSLGDAGDVDVVQLAHPRETDLLRAIGEFPRVLTGAAELRAPHRVARYLEELAGTYHRFYDSCRVLPRGDEEADAADHRPAVAVRGDGPGAAQRPGRARRVRPGADVRAHPAGRCTANITQPTAAGAPPEELGALDPHVWPRSAERIDGELHLGGLPVTELARTHGTPLFVLDEGDFRGRAEDFAAAFADADVHYASKAFLCGQVARWIADDGLHLDACSGNELSLALAAGFPAGADRAARQQQVRRGAAAGGRRGDRAHRARLLRRDRAAGPAGRGPGGRGRRAGPGAHPGHRRHRGAHPRVHRHRPRGPEVRLLPGHRRRADRRGAGDPRAGAAADRPAQPHRLADLRHRRLRGRRAPGGRPARPGAPGHRRAARRAQPRRRLRHRLPRPRTTRSAPPTSRPGCGRWSRRSAPPSACRCRAWRSSRAGRSPAPAP